MNLPDGPLSEATPPLSKRSWRVENRQSQSRSRGDFAANYLAGLTRMFRVAPNELNFRMFLKPSILRSGIR